ncbi:predicted protein [Lichtheimia corymbifera JMRC:FSU:9682]|uniref:Uncharacterized protein n=1 Tax=Lichtheimia corymbifera JMRC:FSU:9682 TaxID=1263082 RepID=A0A068S7J5_9FUNG|nr:predicted protein [Lichtheimia corymbifera JMRC:FSU:9682]
MCRRLVYVFQSTTAFYAKRCKRFNVHGGRLVIRLLSYDGILTQMCKRGSLRLTETGPFNVYRGRLVIRLLSYDGILTQMCKRQIVAPWYPWRRFLFISNSTKINADSSRALTDAVSIATTTTSPAKRNSRGACQIRIDDPCCLHIEQESNYDPPHDWSNTTGVPGFDQGV